MIESKLIAKNAFFLYLRVFFTLSITLFTSRVVLIALGVENFGIYTLVNGVVLLFSFLNNAMASTTQRFLALEIAINNSLKLKKTINATFNIHLILAIILFLMAETVGLWFINTRLSIPINKIIQVNYIYQFSIYTAMINIIHVPYDAYLICKEKMKAYAYLGVLDAILKLIIVYFIYINSGDNLILYSLLLFIESMIFSFTKRIYCERVFPETKYKFFYEKDLYNKLISFSGWNLFGNIAGVAREQGNNILLNFFFGVIVNAAYGITLQIQSAAQLFVSNFQLAITPQIHKQYAIGNVDKSLKLIFVSSKFSYLLMLVICSPILVNIDYLLKLWLVTPPDLTSIFVKLSLINLLIDSISGPLVAGSQASGNIKWYQITIGTLIFLSLPISYFFFKSGYSSYVIYSVAIFMNVFAIIIRLFFLNFIIGLNLYKFLTNVFIKIALVTLCVYFFSKFLFLENENSLITYLIKSLIFTLFNFLIIYFIGLDKIEKKILHSFIIK